MRSKIFIDLQKSVYGLFQRPLFSALSKLAGIVLAIVFLVGIGLWGKGHFEGPMLGMSIIWLVTSILWIIVFKLYKDYDRFLKSCINIAVPALPDRIEFFPEKWDEGFKSHFEAEFVKWGFTEAEQEVGLLLLTGMSQEEIANFRNTTLKTVKNQTTVIYEKAQVKNGRELMSHFIQKLLPAMNEALGKKDK